jgi:hypothetical protein
MNVVTHANDVGGLRLKKARRRHAFRVSQQGMGALLAEHGGTLGM